MSAVKHAVKGILFGFKYEKNFRIMTLCFALVIVTNFILKVNKVEWLFTLLCSGLVMGLELINSSIEKTLDVYSTEKNEMIMSAKDLAAGAVLIISMVLTLLAVMIYMPYILELF